MSKLRLLIKRPGSANTSIPITVDETETIGNCISSLVTHLGFPKYDGLGNTLSYSLRPLSGNHPLSHTLRFADAHLLPETRLVLESGTANAMTWPIGTVRPENTAVPLTPSRQIVSRRTFVGVSVLAGCAASGLFTGIATAFATKKPTGPMTMTASSPAIHPAQMPQMLQQTVLFSGHQQTVRAVNWSPDGTMVASGADDGFMVLWTPDGQIRHQIPHPTGVSALAWSPAGKLLASGSGTSVRFFDGQTAAPLAPTRRVHTGHVTSLAWSHAMGHPLVSGSLDRRAIVWETHHYQPQAIFPHHTTAIDALSCQPNSTTVASASQGGAIRVWDVETLAELHGLYQDAQLPMRAVAFAPVGDQLAVGGDDGLIRVWNNGLVCQQSMGTAQGAVCVDGPRRFRAHSAPVRSISWSPDGRSFATGGEDGMLAIWASPPGKTPTLVTKTIFADPVLAISWSPVHKQLAVASGKTVMVWNLQM